jgi:hypothetical protein
MRMVKLAKRRGYVMYEVLIGLMPPEVFSPKEIKDVIEQFAEMGINVVGEPEAMRSPEEGEPGATPENGRSTDNQIKAPQPPASVPEEPPIAYSNVFEGYWDDTIWRTAGGVPCEPTDARSPVRERRRRCLINSISGEPLISKSNPIAPGSTEEGLSAEPKRFGAGQRLVRLGTGGINDRLATHCYCTTGNRQPAPALPLSISSQRLEDGGPIPGRPAPDRCERSHHQTDDQACESAGQSQQV